MSDNIFVTKSFLPPIEEYIEYVRGIYARHQLTNQGPLLRELEARLKDYFSCRYLHFLTNGTVALQIMLRAFDLTEGEIITTPFSYVATTTSILWERCTPVFVDIEDANFCIDPTKIEQNITSKTKAILAVHVFGYPCAVDELDRIAKRHNIKIFYDAAHTFGSIYKGRSLCDYGDAATLSFHATKLFHTIEGGALVVHDNAINERAELLKRFGHHLDDYRDIGINAKASEFQAAMGLANMPYISEIIAGRKQLVEHYDSLLLGVVGRPATIADFQYNYAYYPIVMPNKSSLAGALDSLKRQGIFPRRYFYPSLNKLPYLMAYYPCPVSESIAERVLCLPLFPGLGTGDVENIASIVKSSLK